MKLRTLLVFAGVVACGPGLKQQDPHEVARNTLVAASGDIGAFEELVRGPVTNGGLWFDDPACRAQFASPGDIGDDRAKAFAHCLSMLKFQASQREDSLGDVAIVTYASGFEVEARVVQEGSGPRLTWIGYEARRDLADALPTVAADALEALRIAGDHNGPLDPNVANDLELDRLPKFHVALAWLKVCVNAEGKVTSVHPRLATSPKAARAFVAAATSWAFRPFMVHDQPVPVCAMVRSTYPPGQPAPPEKIPFPPPPSSGPDEPLLLVEGALTNSAGPRRIAGEKAIHPDDRTKLAIRRARVSTVIGSFRICLDRAGHVESALPIKSTGFATYDRELIAGMLKWIYTPFLDEGAPIPICTGVTFIYAQR